MSKQYTIVKKRVVTQIMSTTVTADSQKEALKEMNGDPNALGELNEWFNDGDPKYLRSTDDDVLEVEDDWI